MHVEYMDHSGSDLLVVNAARASFGKESDWEDHSYNDENDCWVEKLALSAKDAKLIRYLAAHKHVLPFRHPHLTLRCKAPLFVARQLMKHQVGFSWSEESRRYIKTEPEFYYPDSWRKASDNVKQGSSDEIVTMMTFRNNVESWDTEIDNAYQLHVESSLDLYDGMLKAGVAPEQARIVLPVSMETTWVWTGSLLAWVQMLKQRLDSHTQKETRDFANMVAKIVEEKYPISYKALMENA